MTERDMQSTDADRPLAAWLDGLAGRPAGAGVAVQGDRQQGLLLRHLVLQREQSSETDAAQPTAEVMERHWQLIRQGLAGAASGADTASKPAGLIGAVPGIEAVGGQRHAANRTMFVVAAGLAAMTVALSLVWHQGAPGEADGEPEVVMRGTVEPTRVSAPQGMAPAAFADRICRVLDAHQVRYLRVELKNATQVQFKLDAASGAQADLAGLNVHLPANGPINLVVVK